MKTTFPLCITLAALTGSTAFARALEPPPGAPDSKQAVIIDRLPAKGEAFSKDIEGAHFGVWGAAANVGVSLLLGPLGAAANKGPPGNESGNADEALSQLTHADLRSMLATVQTSEASSADAAPAGAHYELFPAGLIRMPRDLPTFSLRCLIHAYLVKDGEPTWHARYLVVVDDSYLKDETAAIHRAKDALPGCLTEAYRLFTGHVDDGLRGKTSTHKVRFDVGDTAKMPVIESELPNRVIVADALGLLEYPRGALAD